MHFLKPSELEEGAFQYTRICPQVYPPPPEYLDARETGSDVDKDSRVVQVLESMQKLLEAQTQNQTDSLRNQREKDDKRRQITQSTEIGLKPFEPSKLSGGAKPLLFYLCLLYTSPSPRDS